MPSIKFKYSMVDHRRVSIMLAFALFFAFTFMFELCSAVPPSPADSLMDDVNGIKVSLKYFAGN